MSDHQHICPECDRKIEYRLFQGSTYEGVSIREVYLNEKNEIEEWTSEPILTLAATKEEVVSDIVAAMEDLDDMLSATRRPILDEADLEARIEKRKR